MTAENKQAGHQGIRRGLIRVIGPWLMRKTLAKKIALVALTLTSGTVAADQTAKTAAQLAVEQLNECADSLFKDEFEPAQIDYELSANKEVVLHLSAKWGTHNNTKTNMTRIMSIGS